jgi:hypothetical protein
VRIRRAAVLLVTAGVLVACSGDPGEPATLPSLTPSPTPTATPTPTTNDLEAATNVVRRYYALLNRLRITMDVDSMAALMAPECHCREQVAAITEAKSRHEHYIDHVRLVSLTPVRESAAQISVLVQYDADRGGLVDEHGRTVTASPPRKGVKRLFRITLLNHHWLITSIGNA